MAELVTRHITALARGALERFPVIVIQGARRCGKSTLAEEIASTTDHTSISLDDDETRASAVADPNTLLAPAQAGKLVVIDEIQRVPDLVLAVKSAVDRTKQPGSFILTGSSDFLSLPQIPDSLAGRAVTIRLRPLSQGEMIGQADDFVTRVIDGIDELAASASSWTRDDYAKAAWRGGYPEPLALDEPWRTMWLDSYIERMTSRDAQSITERVSAERLRSVLRILAANQAEELVTAHVSRGAGISDSSAVRCLDTLKTLFLVDAVPSWTGNLAKREVGRSKAVVSDPGLALHLARVTEAQLVGDPGGDWLGHAIEGFVITELLKQQTWSSSRWNLYHYRDRNGTEVDTVVELADGRVILIEVKASATYRTQHFEPMQKMAERLGDRLVAGIVLTVADHAWRYTNNLVGLPISALWGNAHNRAKGNR